MSEGAGATLWGPPSDHMHSRLIELIEKGNEEEIRQQFVACANVKLESWKSVKTKKSKFDTKGWKAIHHAAYYCREGIVEFLLANGADPADTNNEGENALHVALDSTCGDSRIAAVMELMLEHLAKRADYRDVINAKSKVQWTPLLTAVYYGMRKTFDKLFKSRDPHEGADPTIETDPQFDMIFWAAARDEHILKEILNHPKIKAEGFQLKERLNQGYNSSEFTPLHHAALFGQHECVRMLVKEGAESITDNFGNYPIHLTIEAIYPDSGCFEKIAEELKDSINETDSDGRTILHLCVFYNKPEFVRILRKKTINASFDVKDDKGRLPLHYLCEHQGNEHLVPYLTDNDGCELNEVDKSNRTPLHYAVQEGDHNLVKVILRARARRVDHKQLCDGKSYIHLATTEMKGNSADFKRMLAVFKENLEEDEFKELINKRVEPDGPTALMLAIESQRYSWAEILLVDFEADPCIEDASQRNCLHYAFIYNAPADLVEKIAQKCPETRDKHHNLPIQYLTRKTPLEAVRSLKKLKRQETDEEGEDKPDGPPDSVTKATSLIEAIKLKRYEVVKVLLVNGATVEANTLRSAIIGENKELACILVRHAGMDNLVAILNEVIPTPNYGKERDAMSRLRDGKANLTPQDDHTAEDNDQMANLARQDSQTPLLTSISRAYFFRKRKIRSGPTTLFRELISRMPDVASEALDRCITVSHVPDQESVTFNYCFIHPPTVESGSADSTPKTLLFRRSCEDTSLVDPLKLMVEVKEQRLLQHPVVGSYLHCKWNAIGFGCYMFNLLMYALFLLFLSLFSQTVNNPLDSICTRNVTNTIEDCGSLGRLRATYTFAALVLIFIVYHVIKELIWLKIKRLKYFCDPQNWVEIGLYALAIPFIIPSFVFECGCPSSWQWQIGIVVIFLGWVNLIFFASNFPPTAIPVIMFKTNVKSFFRVAAFALFLIIAFALILFMMFHNPEAQFSSFINFGYSFMTTMNYITGGASFDTLFALGVPPAQFRPIPYNVVNLIVWICFLVLFPIIFNNLLTSLAVNDVSIVRQQAELKKLELQVTIFDKVELLLPYYLSSWFLRTVESTKTIVFKDETGWRRKASLLIWGGKNYLEDIEDDVYEQRRKEERVEIRDGGAGNEELNEMRERQEELFNLVLSLKSALSVK